LWKESIHVKTILAPLDFSAVTSRVVAVATELGKVMDARVVLLHVCEPSVTVVDYAVVSFSVARVDDANVKAATARLDALQHELEGRGLRLEIVKVVGSPVEEIIAQAAALSAVYIVMGSHGHSALHDLVAGGTTHGVLRRAPCSVVIVPKVSGQETLERDAPKEASIQ
jgi:nucleotide-binding universal stress UspA family protein